MQTTRRLKLQALLHEELSYLISRMIKDPRILPVTLTGLEINEEGSQATVLIAPFGGNSVTKQQIQTTLEALQHASGFLRHHLGKRLCMKYIPYLIFREDHGLENTLRVQELLNEIHAQPTPCSS